ncbi:MAG: hypothetical protein LBT40_17620 [Deltaproteobacteria bacterium]|jgi:hypothetical protein|nr:hypothetical protein [Deltaproteobacteria bacterium]
MSDQLQEHEEISNSILLERPARPFHCWLSFRTKDWPAEPAEEVGLPHNPDKTVGISICCMTHGFFAYASELHSRGPKDYEVWYADRVSKIFMRLKTFDSEQMNPNCKYSVPGWARVASEWPPRGNIFDLPDGEEPAAFVLEGRDADRFEASWSRWTGGPIAVVPDDFEMEDGQGRRDEDEWKDWDEWDDSDGHDGSAGPDGRECLACQEGRDGCGDCRNCGGCADEDRRDGLGNAGQRRAAFGAEDFGDAEDMVDIAGGCDQAAEAIVDIAGGCDPAAEDIVDIAGGYDPDTDHLPGEKPDPAEVGAAVGTDAGICLRDRLDDGNGAAPSGPA